MSKISAVSQFDCWERLRKLKLKSLQRRRERFIIIWMFRCRLGEVSNDLEIEFRPPGKAVVCHCREMVAVGLTRNTRSLLRFSARSEGIFCRRRYLLWTVPRHSREFSPGGASNVLIGLRKRFTDA